MSGEPETIEHTPWTPRDYQQGLEGQRTAIVGYSHWREAHAVDYNDFGVDTVKSVVSGEYAGIRFFSDIMRYFGYKVAGEFWSRVLFFNYLPCVVGNESAKFRAGSKQQIGRGASRSLEIYSKYKVERAFVFTTRGWRNHPATEEEESAGKGLPLGNTRFTWGHFKTGGWKTAAIGLRHPQGASGELMRSAVAIAKELPRPAN